MKTKLENEKIEIVCDTYRFHEHASAASCRNHAHSDTASSRSDPVDHSQSVAIHCNSKKKNENTLQYPLYCLPLATNISERNIFIFAGICQSPVEFEVYITVVIHGDRFSGRDIKFHPAFHRPTPYLYSVTCSFPNVYTRLKRVYVYDIALSARDIYLTRIKKKKKKKNRKNKKKWKEGKKYLARPW